MIARAASAHRDEHGGVFLIAAFVVTLGLLLVLAAGPLIGAVAQRARASAAADAASLAGADQVALGLRTHACPIAASVARANGAVLMSCAVGDASVEVVVRVAAGLAMVPSVVARARAEIDWARL